MTLCLGFRENVLHVPGCLARHLRSKDSVGGKFHVWCQWGSLSGYY